MDADGKMETADYRKYSRCFARLFDQHILEICESQGDGKSISVLVMSSTASSLARESLTCELRT